MTAAEPTLVQVRWEDSALVHGWGAPKGACRPVRATTIGLLVEKRRRFVVIAHSVNDAGEASGRIAIPRSAIRSIKEIQ